MKQLEYDTRRIIQENHPKIDVERFQKAIELSLQAKNEGLTSHVCAAVVATLLGRKDLPQHDIVYLRERNRHKETRDFEIFEREGIGLFALGLDISQITDNKARIRQMKDFITNPLPVLKKRIWNRCSFTSF